MKVNSYFSSKKLISIAAVIFLAALLVVAGASCKRLSRGMGEDSDSSGKKGNATLVIISPHGEEIRTELTRGFENWYKKKTGKKVVVEWIDQGGASDDLKYIKSKFEGGKAGIGIDLFYGGGVDPYVELSRLGLLVPVKADAALLKAIPAELNGVPLYDKDGKWYGSSLAGSGIVKNNIVAKKLGLPDAATWTDLTSPKLLGWVGCADPRHSSSSHMLFELVLQRYGWEKGWELLAAIAANARSLPEHSSQVPQDIISGQLAYGMLIDTYAYSAVEQAGSDKLSFVLPIDATVITPDPVAMLKGAPHTEVAREFINFTLSLEGQKLWMFRKGAPGGPVAFSLNKMSVLPSIYPEAKKQSNISVNPFTIKQAFRYDFTKGSTRWALVDDLSGALLIDNHSALVEAWKAASKSGAGVGSFFKVPVSEDEAMKLATEKWGDVVERGKIVSEWKQSAAKKYAAAK